jgi:hypothetical protein
LKKQNQRSIALYPIWEMGLKKRPLKTYNNKRLSERQIKRWLRLIWVSFK